MVATYARGAIASGYPHEDTPNLDLSNHVNVRIFLESLRNQQEGERATWDPHYDALSAFIAPRTMRLSQSDTDIGNRRDYQIINNCATIALRTLGAGLQTGMSSPTRIWFRIGLMNKAINARPDVRQWCEQVDDIIRVTLIKSIFYEKMLYMYNQCGLFGSSAFLIERDTNPDPEANTIIRCKPYVMKQYSLACDDQLRVDLSMRTYQMTARQIREKYGYAQTPSQTKTLIDSPSGGVKETWRTMVHSIMKSSYFGEQSRKITPMPWVSIQYELDAFDTTPTDTAILTIGGYWENPLIVGRWDVLGENIYGEAPAFDCLGDVMSLQSYEDRLSYGLDIMSRPHMLASTKISKDVGRPRCSPAASPSSTPTPPRRCSAPPSRSTSARPPRSRRSRSSASRPASTPRSTKTSS